MGISSLLQNISYERSLRGQNALSSGSYLNFERSIQGENRSDASISAHLNRESLAVPTQKAHHVSTASQSIMNALQGFSFFFFTETHAIVMVLILLVKKDVILLFVSRLFKHSE